MTMSANTHERRFWIIAARYLPHHSLLFLAVKNHNQKLTRLLEKGVRKHLKEPAMTQFPPQVLENYTRATRQAVFWHGAGRYQYAKQGTEIVDVFGTIIRNGHLAPTRDVYSIIITGQEMYSISATKVRVIARSYADTHGRGIKEENRYGSSLWWVAYYYNLTHVELILRHGVAFAKNWSTFNRISRDANGHRSWGKKVHTQARSVWDVFGLGSNIAGNYPILFGIKSTPDTAQLPGALDKWEVRITKPVSLSNLSHIEVPYDKVPEVTKLLRKHGYVIPVFPIEIGELVASKQSLAELLYKK